MQTLAPSDLARLPSGERVRVGGRVIARQQGRMVLADALAAVPVDATVALSCAVGDLVELEGVWLDETLHEASLFHRFAPTNFGRAGSDSQRFLFGGVGRALAARAACLDAVRLYFRQQGFLEVETPVLVPSPGLDVHLSATGAEGGFLITSPEYQMKRLLAGGLPRIFQLTRCFRGGESGRLHNPEFTMLEWYRAFAGVEDVMADTEAIVRAAVGGSSALDASGRSVAVDGPFLRLSVAEAFGRFAGVGVDRMLELAARGEDEYFRVMVESVEPALAGFDRPVFLHDFPAPQASLARRKPEDPRFAERFELYAGGVELCNGFGELTDPAEQRARLLGDQAERRRRGLPVYPIDDRFLDALGDGLPPCAGNALGVDRLVALVMGASRIGDVQAFPSDVL